MSHSAGKQNIYQAIAAKDKITKLQSDLKACEKEKKGLREVNEKLKKKLTRTKQEELLYDTLGKIWAKPKKKESCDQQTKRLKQILTEYDRKSKALNND